MAVDHGPHSTACATAGAGTECDCDCAGAQHAIVTTGGRPAASRVTDRARAVARAARRPVVVGDGSGGNVTETQRPRRLPPAVVERARAARASMPQTAAQWSALVPRGQSLADVRRERLADAVGRRDRIVAERDAFLASHDQTLRDAGIRRSDSRARMIRQTEPYQQFEQVLPNVEAQVAMAQLDVQDITPRMETRPIMLPRDRATNRMMPTPEHQQHLNEILAVGQGVLDAHAVEVARDPEIRAARARLQADADVRAQWQSGDLTIRRQRMSARDENAAYARLNNQLAAAREAAGIPDNYNPRADRRTVARQESQILRELMASSRDFGGTHHTDVRRSGTSRPDAEQRLRAAEELYPTDWLDQSAQRPINLTSSPRAFYNNANNSLSMPGVSQDGALYDGAYRDYTEETNVHELGHRMEYTVPGLTEMEWTMVRRRSTNDRGELERHQRLEALTSNSAYRDSEVAFPDNWGEPYAGKTYEDVHRGEHPGENAWELFQVGTQDTFGRSSRHFDRTTEIQAFTIGAMLTLGAGG